MMRRRFVLSAGTALLAAPARAAEPVPVVASFSLLADLVREVGGPSVAVSSLAPLGVDLHMYEPLPSDLRNVATARVFVINGLGLEGWAERISQAAGFKGTGVVASRGVQALPAAHNHAHRGEGKPHQHGAADPHAWQDVLNVKIYVGNIRDALAAADPANTTAHATRAANYLARLDALDGEIKTMLSVIPRTARRIVTTHEAFNYYADAYAVDFLAPLGLSSHGEPSARAFAALSTEIKRQNIRALFLEQGLPSRLLDQLSRETGVRIGGTLYADTLSPPDGPAANYIEMMRTNTKTIVDALR